MALLQILKNLPRVASVVGASKNPIRGLQDALQSRNIADITAALEPLISSKQAARVCEALAKGKSIGLGQLVAPAVKLTPAVTRVRSNTKNRGQGPIIPHKNPGLKR